MNDAVLLYYHHNIGMQCNLSVQYNQKKLCNRNANCFCLLLENKLIR